MAAGPRLLCSKLHYVRLQSLLNCFEPRSRLAAFHVRPIYFLCWLVSNKQTSQSTYLFVFWLLQGSLSLRLCPSSCHNWRCKRSEAQQKQVKDRQECKSRIPSSKLEHTLCRPKINQRNASHNPRAPGWSVGNADVGLTPPSGIAPHSSPSLLLVQSDENTTE